MYLIAFQISEVYMVKQCFWDLIMERKYLMIFIIFFPLFVSPIQILWSLGERLFPVAKYI